MLHLNETQRAIAALSDVDLSEQTTLWERTLAAVQDNPQHVTHTERIVAWHRAEQARRVRDASRHYRAQVRNDADTAWVDGSLYDRRDYAVAEMDRLVSIHGNRGRVIDIDIDLDATAARLADRDDVRWNAAMDAQHG